MRKSSGVKGSPPKTVESGGGVSPPKAASGSWQGEGVSPPKRTDEIDTKIVWVR